MVPWHRKARIEFHKCHKVGYFGPKYTCLSECPRQKMVTAHMAYLQLSLFGASPSLPPLQNEEKKHIPSFLKCKRLQIYPRKIVNYENFSF